jgi:hypothetical protein
MITANSFKCAIIAGLFTLTSIGCGSSKASTATQPTKPTSPVTTPPVVPAGWVNVDRQYFSLSYPSGYMLTESPSGAQPYYIIATDPAHQHQILVQFVQGFVNQAETFDQCAGVDQYLTDFYTDNFLSMATDPTKYPQTSVTITNGPGIGGFLGGAELDISVVTQEALGSGLGGYTYHLEGVPKAEGLYLIGFENEDYYASPSFFKTFLGTLVLKSKPLPKGSNCSTLN